MGADSMLRRHAPGVLGYGLPFGLILYLAMRGGGYDVLVRDEVGTVIWAAVMVCALAGVPMLARLDRRAWVALGLLAGLTLWIALATLWSESAERSVEELGRVATYLGVLILALAIQGPAGPRRTLFGVAAAIGLVGALAALSRMHPAWFPATNAATTVNPDALRLSYPLDYWNGLGSFLAMGVPLLISAALDARNALARVAATVAVPLVALAILLTFSRGAWLITALALAVFIAVYPRRMRALPLLALVAAGSAALVLAAELRDEVQTGLDTQLARDQGNELLLIALAVSAGVALLRLWLDRAERNGFELDPPPVSRPAALGAVATACALAAIALIASGVIADAWDQFKQSANAGVGAERLTSTASSGRVEYWSAALDAGASAPLSGIGPGSWDLWWSREATIPGFTRDAHSLYLETFAEIGLMGVLLLVGFVGVALFAGASRARSALEEERMLLAGGLAAAAAFALAMALDWGWEIAAIPVAFLFVIAALLGREEREGSRVPEGRDRPAVRAGLMLVAVGALLVIVTAMQGARAIKQSDEARDAGDPQRALEEADRAEGLQPYALTPLLQRVPALQDLGDPDGAAAAAAEATETEPTNWRGWFLLAVVEKARGDLPAAEAAFAEAVELNPQSTNVLAADPSPGSPPPDPADAQ